LVEVNKLAKVMMEPNFPLLFVAALALNLCITFRSSDCWKTTVVDRDGDGEDDAVLETKEELEKKKKWKAVLKKYLAVYLLATLSDWLQVNRERSVVQAIYFLL
jgi:hypothetical protein